MKRFAGGVVALALLVAVGFGARWWSENQRLENELRPLVDQMQPAESWRNWTLLESIDVSYSACVSTACPRAISRFVVAVPADVDLRPALSEIFEVVSIDGTVDLPTRECRPGDRCSASALLPSGELTMRLIDFDSAGLWHDPRDPELPSLDVPENFEPIAVSVIAR